MAYRIEKEQNGKNAIVIDGWEKGTAPDPYSGIGEMLSVDLETPGEVSVGYGITTSSTSGGTLGKPIARSTRYFPTYVSQGIPTGAAQSYAMLDASGQVYESTSITGTWTFLSSSNSTVGSSNLDGIVYWLGYLFKFRNDKIDYWNGTTWSTGWKNITGGVQHFAYVASDNVLYFTNGNYLGSISAPTPASFDPTSSITYAFSITKLALPVTDISLSIGEVGGGNAPQSTLLVGGSQNAVYPWDKISSSFGLPIYVADQYIKRIVSANQNAFIFPGNQGGRGRIYITNGSQAEVWYKIPDYIFGEQDPYYVWGDAIYHRNEIIFGFFPTENSGAGIIQNFYYVWAINLDTKVFRAISQLPVSATFVSNASCLIGAANPNTKGFSYIVGWDNNGSAPGIGYSGTTAGVGTGFLQTDLIPIGSFLQKQTYTQVEFKLRTPLQSGESIQITPIVDASVGTNLVFAPTITTGVISGYAPVTFEKAQWLQLSVSLTGNSGTSGCRLKEIRIR